MEVKARVYFILHIAAFCQPAGLVLARSNKDFIFIF